MKTVGKLQLPPPQGRLKRRHELQASDVQDSGGVEPAKRTGNKILHTAHERITKNILYQNKLDGLALNGKYINSLVPVRHESKAKLPIMQMMTVQGRREICKVHFGIGFKSKRNFIFFLP